jgi:hypothetical protein
VTFLGRSRGLISGTTPEPVVSDWEKSRKIIVRISGLRAEIWITDLPNTTDLWMTDLPNTKQEYQPLGHNVQFTIGCFKS